MAVHLVHVYLVVCGSLAYIQGETKWTLMMMMLVDVTGYYRIELTI